MDRVFKIILYLLLIFAFVAVLTHAAGFSQASGSIFSGLNGLGKTIETGALWTELLSSRHTS